MARNSAESKARAASRLGCRGGRTAARRRVLPLAALARRFELDLVVQFGSTVSGRANAASDRDVAVRSSVPRRRRTLAWQSALEASLERVLGGSPPIDLVVLGADTDPVLLFAVASGGRPLWSKSPVTWEAYCSYAARVFDDAEPFRRALRRRLEAIYG